MMTIDHAVANEETYLAKPMFLLHSLDEVCLLCLGGIPEFRTHSDLVGETHRPILLFICVSRLLANPTALI